MKKPLVSRILGLMVLYCTVFCILVILQFTNRGNFSMLTEGMSIRGRHLLEAENYQYPEIQSLTGGVRINFAGVEFNLREERGRGMTLANMGGAATAVNPSFMVNSDNMVQFGLPGGTMITFSSFLTARGRELNIHAEFADNVSEITIPITIRRSIVRDNGQLGILYSGMRYGFIHGLGQELEYNRIILTRENSFISYRSRVPQFIFNPENYKIPDWQDYERALASWRASIYAYWRQNISSLQSEDDVTAFSAEAMSNNTMRNIANSIPASFLNSNLRTHRSAAFIGGMNTAHRTFIAAENEKLNLITRLTRERSPGIFREYRVMNFLFTRSNIALSNEVIALIQNLNNDRLTIDYTAGLLEAYHDIRQWRPELNNPVDHLMDNIISLISENINRDTARNLIYVSGSEGDNLEFSLRLGKALINWADSANNSDWSAIGRSMIMSIISNGNLSSGRIHNILKPGEFYPKATWLMDNGMWAWTVSPSIRASYIGSDINLAISAPVNSTHHVMIRGIRPFIRLQIHGQDWRTDSLFEIYDASGWVYHAQDQTLVLKLRHRLPVENVRIIYTAPPPPPVEVIEAVNENEIIEVIEMEAEIE